MKITALSDLHFEFHKGTEWRYYNALPWPVSGPLVIAGDLCCFGILHVAEWRPAELVKRICGDTELVIYVPGNHEYYHSDPLRVDEQLHTIAAHVSNFKLLEAHHPVEYQGQRFVGDTMWFRNCPECFVYKRTMNDPFVIKDYFDYVFARNAELQGHLLKVLQPGDIVVTHHMPSLRSVPAPFKNSPTQPFFVCDQEKLIYERRPAAWIHGHTHSKHDYLIGDTRVICNPVGYPGENGYLPEAALPCEFEVENGTQEEDPVPVSGSEVPTGLGQGQESVG